jgi:adenosine kinase
MVRNKTYSNVIVTGSVAYDEIMDFPSEFRSYFHPERLHQINVSFVVDRLEKQLGGTATNIAYNLKLITQKKVTLLTAIGKDGGSFINFFKARDIDTSGIIIDKGLYTASGKVITDIKDNQIWGFYYGALIKGKKISLKKYINSQSLVIISATHKESFIHTQKQAIETKVDYLYDPGMALTWIGKNDLKKGIENCRILVGNDYEIAQTLKFASLTKDSLLKKDIVVTTTLGEKGARYQDKKNQYFVSGYKIKKVIDPTGAGDAWRGGFVAGLVDGKTIVNSLKQGNALASFAIEAYGTVNHQPTVKEILERANQLTVN